MALPQFLIIGAMKAGTTTLYNDLCRHPQIYMPARKEPEILVRAASDDDACRAYEELFRNAPSGALLGEASTIYTKRPVFEGAAERAAAILGPELRILYIRRDPIERIVSHYQHEIQTGKIAMPFEEALYRHSDLIDFTRYDWQLQPWRNCFATERIMELDLSEFSTMRAQVVNRVLLHLGLNPMLMPPVDVTAIANRVSDMKRIDNPLLDRIIGSALYQKQIKPRIPAQLRARSRHLILPQPAAVPILVSAADRQYIADRLAEDAE